MSHDAAVWQQTYSLFGQGVGISALIASLPIVTLLLLLGVLRKPAWMAGTVGLAVALALAVFAYGMPVGTAVSAAAYGGAFGLFPICWIIFWAIALFRVTVETGKFEIIRNSIGRLTPDPRLQALLVAFAFGAFLEGAAGFGTPVAVAATMMTGFGFSAFSASALCLLANTVPVAFGAIGIPVITLAGTTGLPLDKLSRAVALLCSPAALIIPVYLILAMGGLSAMSGVWVPALAAGIAFAGIQFVVATFVGPQLSALLAAMASMAVLVAVIRLRRETLGSVREISFAGVSARVGGPVRLKSPAHPGMRVLTQEPPEPSFGQMFYAWLPYVLLVACVCLWGFAPVQKLLNRGSLVFAWPMLDGLVQRMPPVTAAPSFYRAVFSFNFFSAAGTACMMATLLAAMCLGLSPARLARLLAAVTRQLALPIFTIVVVLGIGFLMNYCGATASLGLAFASTGKLFPLFSPFLGLLGVFLTGSDTSCNALFGNLQVVTATRLGLDPMLMAAANAAGGVMGKMISVQTIAVAAAATGLSVLDQARLFRFTLRHSIFLGFVIGCLALFYVYGLHL
jgi:L-lactate transport